MLCACYCRYPFPTLTPFLPEYPHHSGGNPNPSIQFDAGPDPTYQSDVEPVSDFSLWCRSGSRSCNWSKLCKSATTGLRRIQNQPVTSLHCSICSLLPPPAPDFDWSCRSRSGFGSCFFDFDVDPDSAIISEVLQDTACQNVADPCIFGSGSRSPILLPTCWPPTDSFWFLWYLYFLKIPILLQHSQIYLFFCLPLLLRTLFANHLQLQKSWRGQSQES